MYTLPDHLKSIPAIKRISDVKYKLTELGSLLEFLLKEIDQDQNPTLSLGELVFHYSNLFSAPKLVSTAIRIRNVKIHGSKHGGRAYTQYEIQQAPEPLFQAVSDLLPHVPREIAEAVRREDFDLGDVIQTVVKHIQTIQRETPKQIAASLPPPIKPIPTSVAKIDSSGSVDGAKILGGIALAGLAIWGISALASKAPTNNPVPKPAPKQTFSIGCIILAVLMLVFFIIVVISTGTPK